MTRQLASYIWQTILIVKRRKKLTSFYKFIRVPGFGIIWHNNRAITMKGYSVTSSIRDFFFKVVHFVKVATIRSCIVGNSYITYLAKIAKANWIACRYSVTSSNSILLWVYFCIESIDALRMPIKWQCSDCFCLIRI